MIAFLILIDGCILFAFNYLFHELIEEKSQGITELLRLISIRPILNSLAWFLRVFIVQLIAQYIINYHPENSFRWWQFIYPMYQFG